MGGSFRAGHQAELEDSVTDSFKPPPPAPLHGSKTDASVATSYPSSARSPLLHRTRDYQSLAVYAMGRSFRAGHQAELTDSVTDSFKPPPPAPLHRSKPDASVARSYPSLVHSPLLQRTRDSQSFAVYAMGRSSRAGHQVELEDSVTDAFNKNQSFGGLKLYVKELDSNTLPPFLEHLCDPDKKCRYTEEEVLCVFETAAEVYGCTILRHISQIVSTIIRIMSSGTGSSHSVGCSKVMCALSCYVIDPLGTEQEKSGIIWSLCSPLSRCLMSTNESVSSGSALCATALIQSNNWQFAPHDLVNDICLKVSAALEEVHCQTISHLGLVVALLKQNRLTIEPYGRSLIRSGLSILDESTKGSNSQMIISSIQMIHCILKGSHLSIISSEISTIINAAERLLDNCTSEISTAACQAVEIVSILCSEMRNKGAISAVISTESAKRSTVKSIHRVSRSVKRKRVESERNYKERKIRENHNLFSCSLDESKYTSLKEYADRNRNNLVTIIQLPKDSQEIGNEQTSRTTANEPKVIFRRAYQLLKRLNRVGLTLRGKYGSNNFIISEYLNLKFSVPIDLIRRLTEGDAEEDEHTFVHMVKREVFQHTKMPSDVVSWLFLIDACETSYDDLKLENINMMDEKLSIYSFMSMYDTLHTIETSDNSAYNNIIKELEDTGKYSGWQTKVNEKSGNYTLKDTMVYRKSIGLSYNNDIRGLLDMLRNSRQHSARAFEDVFARIICQHFPDLMADLQRAMFREGYRQLTLKYSMP